MPLSEEQVRRLAGLELNALHFTGVTPHVLEGARIESSGTPIFDINGTLLFRRIPIAGERGQAGWTDVAVDEVMGEPLLAVSTGAVWDEAAIREEASAAARRRGARWDEVRFVAYSFPKVAVQFLEGGAEVLMLEWRTWAEVPPTSSGREPNFERWSLIDEMPTEMRRARVRGFRRRMAVWDSPEVQRIETAVITRAAFARPDIILKMVDTREVHYSPRAEDHHPCYELRGQQTGVWCVAASVEMLLNFYRYQYDQPRLAQEMDLGTCAVPNGLPYGEEHKVVECIERLSSNTLDATALANPGWSVFTGEIQANRPLISFIPRHSRTVAGYTRSLFTLPGRLPFSGLLVYDPWPPTDCAHPENGGVITSWENFATQTYRYAFTAVLQQV